VIEDDNPTARRNHTTSSVGEYNIHVKTTPIVPAHDVSNVQVFADEIQRRLSGRVNSDGHDVFSLVLPTMKLRRHSPL